jgi:ATP-dependent helicase HrpB
MVAESPFLPIDDVLPRVLDHLETARSVVLVAPPGAGKTTRTPLALARAEWAAGRRIIMLEPRRLAARQAAMHMARAQGEVVGESVGYRVRFDSQVTARTRIEVVTEGVFTAMILDDPGLEGVAAVLFDEFHERSFEADLGLALARDCQALLREDLRLVVMSATLDAAAVAKLLDGAEVIESAGRAYPVATHYLGRDPRRTIEEETARAVGLALREQSASVLAFLPGRREIERVAAMLRVNPLEGVDVAPLYGELDSGAQDRAIAPPALGRRKIVLATAVAQTSLTIEAIGAVVDSGLARAPRFDPVTGVTRLETVPVSLSAADQRRGRAGRLSAGVCYRLWDEAATRALPAQDRPEILNTDLARLALLLARWGVTDIKSLALLDTPPPGRLEAARTWLAERGMLTADGALTPYGRDIAQAPLAPSLTHMIRLAEPWGRGRHAALIAVLLTERGLGGEDVDVDERLNRLALDRGRRARDAVAWARRLTAAADISSPRGDFDSGAIIAAAFPDWIAKARDKTGEFQLANGRGAFLPPEDPLARETWIAVAKLGAAGARDRIALAARLDCAFLMQGNAGPLIRDQALETSPSGALRVVETVFLGRLALSRRMVDRPESSLIEAALRSEFIARGPAVLPWGPRSRTLRARIAHLRRSDGSWPDMSDEGLRAAVDIWLTPCLVGRRSLSGIEDGELEKALRSLVQSSQCARLDRDAPTHWTAPSGQSYPVDYEPEAGPRLEVRVQDVFGLDRHPVLPGGAPLTLVLLSPARRPLQVTKDLPGFWRGSWADVRKDMRGRYPKHDWPETPATAVPGPRGRLAGS